MTIETQSPDRRSARQRHSKALDVARRGLSLVMNHANEQADSIYEQPASRYLDLDRFELEKKVLFRGRPVFAGLSVELPAPGSYKTLDLPGCPLVIARQADGSLRAFVNACLHRGANVAYDAGAARTFVCKFHGWAYNLDGSLRKVRGGDNFGQLDPGCTGLAQVPVAEKYGLIFVRGTRLAENPEPIDVDEALCGLGPQFAEWGLEMDLATPAIHPPVVTASNWKLAVDGYLEPYHFASLHKTTVAKYNNSNQATVDLYGPHVMSGFLGRKINELAEVEEDDWPLMRHVQLIYFLFPNVILSVMQDHVEYSLILPGRSVAENVMHHNYFAYTDWSNADVHEKRFHNTQWILTAEDIPMAEECHRNIAEGAIDKFYFGRNEPALQHFHKTIETELAAAQH
ncbi:aromatic ring-hydroxylating oxygenase subunit alpha [Acrocarpospora catenulata]|uniref:aromatic ring-hydroxylating oxygenase subunit alpha n=1 Tax=Acrocarpospora catenulata TaxID=2836182 RepID=UPI001BDA9C04|nr:aromatic ring-hydroxylating dioxygenase subunit alpha [Acrocarpospora catenulata]